MISIPIRVISKNVRYATTSPFQGEELWATRKQYLINELRFNVAHNAAAFICCQEVLHQQLLDIVHGLNEEGNEWHFIGCGRDDGKEKGEYSPIFYRSSIWECLEKDFTWFSPTPKIPSRDPDAGSIRIFTRAKFRHRGSNRVIRIYSTHLDDQSSDARQRAADAIVKITGNDSDIPAILAGDFNSEPFQEAYQTITKLGPLVDIYYQISEKERYGNDNTYTGFGFENEPAKRIDYIFANFPQLDPSKSAWKATGYGVLTSRWDDGIFNSDHRAVVADLVLR
jgi:endonuclease/exonuclease/phosphatase family metal-dependent hydrolase